jgi:AcrR family transcriptional regulator
MIELSKTKELIFDAFVEMTSALGYENVSMRELASKVGIQVASIYNHFTNKDSILELAYKYHALYQYDNRKPVEYMKKLMETASPAEIIDAFYYTHDSEDPKRNIRMVLIIKIINMRLFQDPLANAEFMETDTTGRKYILDIIRHGVEIGRISPEFDAETFAEIFIGTRQITGIKAFANINYEVHGLDPEGLIKAMITTLLSTGFIS